MFRRLIDRILAILTVSALLGWRILCDITKKHDLGYDGFIAYENTYYNRYIKNLDHRFSHFLGCAIVVLFVFVAYELIAYIFRRIFRVMHVQSS